MNENFKGGMIPDEISGQYDVEKKSRLRKFYDSNKILIFSSLSTILIIILTFSIFTY